MNAGIKRTAVLVALALVTVSCGKNVSSNEQRWTPPENPNPEAILQEAEADRRAGRYEDSLAKHVWFHENALKIQPAEYGVRLSFALGDWVNLAHAYPPALEKLKSIRDDDEKKIRENKSSRDLFHDFESINEHLEDFNRTKDTFIWLDTNTPDFAKSVFDIAEPDLVRTKEYRLCGKYLDPDTSFERIRNLYQDQIKIGQEPEFGEDLSDFPKKYFSNESATLVALLAVNGRTNDANHVAAEAEKILNDSAFKALLEKAKKGDVPAPWP